MTKNERIIVYVVGFGIGMLLVSFIISRRAAKFEQAEDPWYTHQREAEVVGAEPIPEYAPEALRKGRLLAFGTLPVDADPEQKVWLLNFDKSYPYIRVVQELATGGLEVTAADQVVLKLAENVDVTALKPALDALELRIRNFNRKERIAVVSVIDRELDAVPRTLEALQDWSELFVSAEADVIKFRD